MKNFEWDDKLQINKQTEPLTSRIRDHRQGVRKKPLGSDKFLIILGEWVGDGNQPIIYDFMLQCGLNSTLSLCNYSWLNG